jgi:polar amino acid transport system permease protein
MLILCKKRKKGTTVMDWSYIGRELPRYIEAGLVTLKIGFWGILAAVITGLVCCFVLYYKIVILQNIVKVYVELSRNTPLLIQVFFLYFGLPQVGIKLSGTACAIIGLGFLGGSYMAEAFRGGLEAVRNSQIETGLSIGLDRRQMMQYVILPQAISISMPQVSANFIFLLKETSILSAIAIPELLHVTQRLIGLYYKTNESLLLLTVSYLIIILPLSILLGYIERRLRHAEFGN